MEEHNLRRPTGLGISLNSFAGGPSAVLGISIGIVIAIGFFK